MSHDVSNNTSRNDTLVVPTQIPMEEINVASIGKISKTKMSLSCQSNKKSVQVAIILLT